MGRTSPDAGTLRGIDITPLPGREPESGLILPNPRGQSGELRYFGGLTHPEIANVLGVSERTVRNDWTFARAWLKRELSPVEA